MAQVKKLCDETNCHLCMKQSASLQDSSSLTFRNFPLHYSGPLNKCDYQVKAIAFRCFLQTGKGVPIILKSMGTVCPDDMDKLSG